MYVGYLVEERAFPHTIEPHITIAHFPVDRPDPQELYDLDMVSDELYHPTALLSLRKEKFGGNNTVLLMDDNLLRTIREAFHAKLMARNPSLALKLSNDFPFTPHVTYTEPDDFVVPAGVTLKTPMVAVFKTHRGNKLTRFLGL